MASGKEYLAFILDQLSGLEEITYRAMMGECIIYYGGKIIGGIYDDRFLVKPVKSAISLMPIVIADPKYRYKGIGRKIILALVQRGRDLGYDHLCVEEIYDWNEASKRCFESVGFRPDKKTEKGMSYRLAL